MTNDPTSAAYELDGIDQAIFEFAVGREKQVPSHIRDALINSQPSVIKLKKAIEQAIAEAETRGRIDELEWLKKNTLVTTRPEAFISDANVSQNIRIHTNSLVEHRLMTLQANADGANGRDGEDK